VLDVSDKSPSPRSAHSLRLPPELRARIERLAVASHPREACGLLLGHREAAGALVVEVHAARNLDASPAGERFDLDPADHLAAEQRARARGLEVVGIWHSHPDQPARPSELDRAQALGGWSYVIVSVAHDAALDVRSWRLEGTRFVEEAVPEREAAGRRSGLTGSRSATTRDPRSASRAG
jgi:proteasome lid subunit RPN8/RPN11